MEDLRRLAWWILLLLLVSLVSQWILEAHRTIDHRLIEFEIGGHRDYCAREFYRIRSEDLNDIRNRLKTVEYVLGVRPKPNGEALDEEASQGPEAP